MAKTKNTEAQNPEEVQVQTVEQPVAEETTGGTEEMLNRVTLIDTPKIMNYEMYTKKLTELTVRTMAEFSPDRTYVVVDDGQVVDLKKFK